MDHDEVIIMDGVQRSVITVNNTIPGPTIVAFEDQELIVHVTNHLLSDSVTIHWHGLHQRDTPFMDGVAYITQCPISAGQIFTYKFTVLTITRYIIGGHIQGLRFTAGFKFRDAVDG